MTRMASIAGAAALTLANIGITKASDWMKVEDPNELRALYANKTHHQSSYAREATMTHYRADGKALFVQGERRIPRTWEVKGKDQVCWRDEIQGQSCVRVQRNRQNASEIMTQSADGGFALVGGMVRIEDGIPKF